MAFANNAHHSLGRSSGKGSFGIWTHNLKGIEFHDSFVPQDAPANATGIPAVTLQAGEQWFGKSNIGPGRVRLHANLAM